MIKIVKKIQFLDEENKMSLVTTQLRQEKFTITQNLLTLNFY